MNRSPTILIHAAGIADAASAEVTGGSILLERAPGGGVRVLAVGRTKEVTPHEAAGAAQVMELPDFVLIPGLVNAHSHLDLTHIGPVPPDAAGGFAAFAKVVMSGRAQDAAGIAASVERGIRLSLAGGTVAVGDIAGSPGSEPSFVPCETLAKSPLRGVSYLEFFGIGRSAGRHPELGPRPQEGHIQLGLQPHAPYSVSLGLYAWAAGKGLLLSTHLAESPEEQEFIARGTGPLREMLERIGVWDGSILAEIGHGQHPVHHLRQFLHSRPPPLLAHVNDCPDEALAVLVGSGASVAYCPRSSEYFRAEAAFGPHRYRDMLRAGVNVCLGTDSIINLPGDAISVLDEMRRLHARDGTEPRTLLRMATVNGAAALGLQASQFTFGVGAEPLGVIAVDVSGTAPTLPPLARVLASCTPATLVIGPPTPP